MGNSVGGWGRWQAIAGGYKTCTFSSDRVAVKTAVSRVTEMGLHPALAVSPAWWHLASELTTPRQ